MRRFDRFDLLEFKFFRPGDHRAPDELVRQHNHAHHGGNSPNDRACVAGICGGLKIGTQARQPKIAVSQHEHFAGHQEKPSAGHGHHRIPNESDSGVGQFHLHKTLPPAPAIDFSNFAHLARYGFQGGIKAEGHVPDLAGKNQKDGAELDAELARGKKGHHGQHNAGQKT